MTRSSPRCFAMKAAFESEVLVQELIGVVGKSTTHPRVPENWTRAPGSRHAPFLRVATHGTPSASPDEPSNGRDEETLGYPGRVLVPPFTFFRVPEGERSVLSAAQIKFVTLVVRRVQRAPLGPDLMT